MMLAASTLNAQITDVTASKKSVKQYDAIFFNVTLTGIWDNPYLQEEAALDMILTAPSGKQLVLPCFYKSGEIRNHTVAQQLL
jgi:hypothetical protein